MFRASGQTALEFLITYGWAILIIVVIVGVLAFELNSVSSGNATPVSCLSAAGIVCTNPVMNVSGYIAVNISVLGAVYNVTSIACTPSTAQPNSSETLNLPSPVLVTQNNATKLVFKCPIVLAQGQSPYIGDKFAGDLWIIYKTQTQSGLLAKLATISATSTTSVALATNSMP